MAGRNRESFNKRQLEKNRQEAQAAKRERRQAAKSDELVGDETPVDPDELLERFRLINEAHSAGELDSEQFAIKEQEILIALGINADG